MAGEHRPVDVELAELRRRAYGPDADIEADPAAQLRLRTLEAREQQEGAPRLAEGGASSGDPTFVPSTPDDGSSGHDSEKGARVPASTTASWRRAGPWAITVAATILALAAGSAVLATELSRPRAELTLISRPIPADVSVPGISTTTLQSWDIPPGALGYHGRVGALDVWTMTGGTDAECLLLSVEGSFYKQACVRGPLDPQIDVLADLELIPPGSIDPAVPPGSTVRIAVRDAVVGVYIARPHDGI